MSRCCDNQRPGPCASMIGPLACVLLFADRSTCTSAVAVFLGDTGKSPAVPFEPRLLPLGISLGQAARGITRCNCVNNFKMLDRGSSCFRNIQPFNFFL